MRHGHAPVSDVGPTEHDHGHGHVHSAASLVGRLTHGLSEFLGGHSHDAADQIDDALEADRDGRRALLISLLVLAVTALIEGLVVVLSGSVALLGDTLHNVADAMTAVPLLIAFRLAKRPATKRYTYGYGRAEDLGGLFVVAMITLSSGLAAYEAIDRLIHPRHVDHLWVVAIAGLVGFLGNEVVAQYRIRIGRRIGSAALVADGLHARTDGFTSLAVLVGAGGVALGWRQADPIVGLVITVAILGVLRSAVRQVLARLMDAVDRSWWTRRRRRSRPSAVSAGSGSCASGGSGTRCGRRWTPLWTRRSPSPRPTTSRTTPSVTCCGKSVG
jgi:cation diffusion facilitator family transporter